MVNEVFNKDFEPTRVQKTEEHYRRVYKSLEGRARIASEIAGTYIPDDEPVDFDLVINAFLEHRENLSASTDRQYMAAIMFIFTLNDPLRMMDEFKARERLLAVAFPQEDRSNYYKNGNEKERRKWIEKKEEMLRRREIREREVKRSRSKKRSAAQKAKKLPLTDIEMVLIALKNSGSRYARDVAVWFQAALIVGLRPSEWAKSTIGLNKKGQKVLVVFNGKNTNNRSFGEKRSLILEDLSPEQMQIVEFQLMSAQAEEARGHFESWYESCRSVLKILTRSLWPDRRTFPSLYTARHLFAASAKMRLTRKEVAALMGHGSEFTAGTHYARRHSAISEIGVSPSEEDLNALTLRNGETSQEPKTNAWLEEKRNGSNSMKS